MRCPRRGLDEISSNWRCRPSSTVRNTFVGYSPLCRASSAAALIRSMVFMVNPILPRAAPLTPGQNPPPTIRDSLSMRRRPDLFVNVRTRLIVSQKVLGEVLPSPLGRVRRVLAKCVTRARQVYHVETLVRLDQRVN